MSRFRPVQLVAVIALVLFMLIPENGWAETEVAGYGGVSLTTNAQCTLGGAAFQPAVQANILYGAGGFGSGDTGWKSSTSLPIPDIKVNDSDGPLVISQGTPVTLTVQLNAGSYVGFDADWWVVAYVPGSWYYFNAFGQWILADDLSSVQPAYQGPLFNLPSFPVLSSTPLPTDTYIVYFGVDPKNGNIDDVVCYDSVLFTIIGGDTPTPGNVYYVATTGDNANIGSASAPWATPGYGSRQLQPGDTLIIRGGTYTLREFDADIITPPSGTANAWIAIKGEPGKRPILAGRDNLLTAVDLGGKSYVRLENLEITAASGALFRGGVQLISGQSSNVILKDLYIHHIDEEGINIQDVNGLLITDCIISYCGYGAISGPAGQYGGFRNGRIIGCTLSWSGHYYQGGDGSNRPYDRPDGFGIEESRGPIEIINTVSEHNYGDGLDSKSANTTIQRCIVANNSCDGVKLWDTNSRVENTLIYGRGDGNSTTSPWSAIVIGTEQTNATFTLVNNTVDDALGNNYLMYVQYDTPNIPVVLTMLNNIFCSRGPNASIFLSGAVVMTNAYNLYYFPDSGNVLAHGGTSYDSTQVSAMGAGNRYGDPQFLAIAWGTNGDYHVPATSPAMDTATAFGAPAVALDGTARPQGNGYDMGAYER